MAEFNGSTGYTMNIPGNVVVSWSLVSQAANQQTLQVIDPNNTTENTKLPHSQGRRSRY